MTKVKLIIELKFGGYVLMLTIYTEFSNFVLWATEM